MERELNTTNQKEIFEFLYRCTDMDNFSRICNPETFYGMLKRTLFEELVPRYLPLIKDYRTERGDSIALLATHLPDEESLRMVDEICKVNPDCFNWADEYGNLCFFPFSPNRSVDYIREFASRTGINLNNRNFRGATLLKRSGNCSYMINEKLKALVELGADPTIRDYYGLDQLISASATQWFSLHSDIDADEVMLEPILVENAQNGAGRTILMNAIDSLECQVRTEENRKLFEKSLALSRSADEVDLLGETALHKMVFLCPHFSADDMSRLVAKAPMSLNARNKEGLRPAEMLCRCFRATEEKMMETLSVLNPPDIDLGPTRRYHNTTFERAAEAFLSIREHVGKKNLSQQHEHWYN